LLLILGLVGALVAGGLGWQRAIDRSRRLEQLQAERGEIDRRIQAVDARAGQTEALEAEVARLRKDTEDLHRLRGQYQQWEKLKEDYAKLQQQNLQLQQSQQATAQALQAASATAAQPPASWIGIALQPNATQGVIVQSVVPGGPAANSGLAPGDVISRVNGQQVTTVPQLQSLITAQPVGRQVIVDALRGGNPLRVVVTTGNYPR
jgi:C-terminal processing protease CtpA/Prc